MKKQAVFLDIDGCLTTGKNNPIPWEHVKSLQQTFKEYGDFYEYIIVTARPASYAEAVVQFLGLMDTKKHKHAVCESGGVSHLFGSDTYVVSEAVDQELLSGFENNLRRLQNVYKFRIEDGRKRTITVLAADGQTIKGLSMLLKEYMPNGLGMHCSAGGIDIMPEKIDKSVAVAELAKKLKISLDDSISIGDSGSDLPLMKTIGYPACPANASENVKELVREKNGYIAKKEYALGVVEILEHYYKRLK